MSQDCVVGVYDSFERAGEAVRALDEFGFPHNQVSFVTFQVTNRLAEPDAIQNGAQTETSTALGAATGGLLGLLLGTPLLAIPGVGPALVAGPLAVGLTGAVVGGLLGAMKRWGVHADQVQKYQRYVDDGKLLVVASGNQKQVADALRVLQGTDSIEINTHADISADAVDVTVTSGEHPGIIVAPDDKGHI